MSYVLCQRCGDASESWTINQAEFNVGRIDNWKIQLCQVCTKAVEVSVLVALKPMVRVER